jgi:hypothetical protein
MKREPFSHMVNSVVDCFVHPMPGEGLVEMFCNAVSVVTGWWDPVAWDRKFNGNIGG